MHMVTDTCGRISQPPTSSGNSMTQPTQDASTKAVRDSHADLDGSQKEEGDGGHCQVQNEPPEGQVA